MPNRIIKESIRTSKKINKLSDFEFRVWAYLITYVDDYGRGSADSELLNGLCFPRRKGITEKQIDNALSNMANIGIIRLYENDGESYFCFPNWEKHQSIRAKKSKFPAPDESCMQMQADVSKCEQMQANAPVIQSESNPNPNPNPNPTRAQSAEDLLAQFDFSPVLSAAIKDWLAYKQEKRQAYKPVGLKSLLSQIYKAAAQYGPEAVAEVIGNSMANGYQGITFDTLSRRKPQQAKADRFAWMESEHYE